MLALSEFGGMADIGKMRQYRVYWAWVASWNGFTSGYAPTELTRLYSDPRLLNAPITLDVTPPAVSSLSINAGAAQRSMVRQVSAIRPQVRWHASVTSGSMVAPRVHLSCQSRGIILP